MQKNYIIIYNKAWDVYTKYYNRIFYRNVAQSTQPGGLYWEIREKIQCRNRLYWDIYTKVFTIKRGLFSRAAAYGGTIGNEYFQFHSNTIIIPAIKEFFKIVKQMKGSVQDNKGNELIQGLMEDVGLERLIIAINTGTEGALSFGGMDSSKYNMTDVIYYKPGSTEWGAWYDSMKNDVVESLSSLLDELKEKKRNKTITLSDLLSYLKANEEHKEYKIQFMDEVNLDTANQDDISDFKALFNKKPIEGSKGFLRCGYPTEYFDADGNIVTSKEVRYERPHVVFF